VFDGGVHQKRISLNRFVEITSTNPARIFGMWPARGTLAPGSIADIVVFDPDKLLVLSAKTLHMNVDYNPYEGREVRGAAEVVMARGKIIIEDGKYVGAPGDGTFIRRGERSI